MHNDIAICDDIGRAGGRAERSTRGSGCIYPGNRRSDKLCCGYKIWQDLYAQGATAIKQVVDHNLIGTSVGAAVNCNAEPLKANIEINCD